MKKTALYPLLALVMHSAHCAPYAYTFCKKPAENLPPAYGICMKPDGKAHLFLSKQTLKNPMYRRQRNIYHLHFGNMCSKMKGKYMGGDSGVRQRAQTFNTILNRLPKAEAEKIRKLVYFDTRYHTLQRPGQVCHLASGKCSKEIGYRPGNGHGLRLLHKKK